MLLFCGGGLDGSLSNQPLFIYSYTANVIVALGKSHRNIGSHRFLHLKVPFYGIIYHLMQPSNYYDLEANVLA